MPLPSRINVEDLEEALDQWCDELESASFEEPLRRCLPEITQAFENNFMNELGDNGPWAPRARAYKHPPLILTGALIEAARDTGNPGNIHDVEANTLYVGVNVDVVNYAGFHQNGTRKMPARPYIWVDDASIDACAEVFLVHWFTVFV